jgi:short-subunit dehydrogenase
MARRSFAGKRILLTGASSGIGWYLASLLVRAGAYVVVTGRRAERLAQLRLSFGNPDKRLIAVPGDISDPAHREKLIATAERELGGLDILINNAGIGAIGCFADASPERLRRVFEVDFFAAAELTRLALPLLKKGSQPAIGIVSSVLAHRGVPGKSEYCAAKFAMRGWAESLRVELKSSGIDVISVSPSTTESEFFDNLVDTSKHQSSASFGRQSAESVAKKVFSAMKSSKREMILSAPGKALVWFSRLAPARLVDRVLRDFAMPAALRHAH